MADCGPSARAARMGSKAASRSIIKAASRSMMSLNLRGGQYLVGFLCLGKGERKCCALVFSVASTKTDGHVSCGGTVTSLGWSMEHVVDDATQLKELWVFHVVQ